MIRPLYGPDFNDDFFATLAALSETSMPRAKAGEILRKRMAMGIKTFVYLEGERIIGTASIFIEPKFLHNGGKVAHIEDIAVHPDYQRRGIGSALVEHLLNLAKQEGAYKAILSCQMKNLIFYVNQGFKQHEISLRKDL